MYESNAYVNIVPVNVLYYNMQIFKQRSFVHLKNYDDANSVLANIYGVDYNSVYFVQIIPPPIVIAYSRRMLLTVLIPVYCHQ